MAQWLKGFLHQHEDLSLILSTHVKAAHKSTGLKSKYWGSRDRGIHGVYWRARLAGSVSSWINERPCFSHMAESTWGRHSMPTFGVCMCVPPYKLIHVQTYIEHIHPQNGSLSIWNLKLTGKPDWFWGLEQGTIWLHDTDPHLTFFHDTIRSFNYPIKSPSHQLATRPLLIKVHFSQGFVCKESSH